MSIKLAQGLSRVALALHLADCSAPFLGKKKAAVIYVSDWRGQAQNWAFN